MLEVYDNVLEPHVAELIDLQMRDVSWKYNYKSHANRVNRHWHVLCGHDDEECNSNGFDYIPQLWETIRSKYLSDYDYIRIYMNAHTHGIEPHLHTDDGDVTVIYYPRLDWKKEWAGGTLVDSPYLPQYVDYVGNRIAVFDAVLPHQAMPVSRQCYELRTCVVFKCEKKDA
jgi:Rps23 Pro-64 3,4-dihydroxylase Tpa1-like proline 4-hydroxylase